MKYSIYFINFYFLLISCRETSGAQTFKSVPDPSLSNFTQTRKPSKLRVKHFHKKQGILKKRKLRWKFEPNLKVE
jgi:hypothetical protein